MINNFDSIKHERMASVPSYRTKWPVRPHPFLGSLPCTLTDQKDTVLVTARHLLLRTVYSSMLLTLKYCFVSRTLSFEKGNWFLTTQRLDQLPIFT